MMNNEPTGLEHIENSENDEQFGICIKSKKTGSVQPLFIKHLSESEFKRYINSIKQTIRTSFEYRKFIDYCKGTLDLNRCAVLSNISDEDDVTIEIHHYPFTIHDIIEIVIENKFKLGLPVMTIDIADEIMKCHYQGLIGVVPLCKTVHELVHSGQISLHLNQIYGDPVLFMKRYALGLSSEHLSKLKKFYDYSKENKLEESRKVLELGLERFTLSNPEESGMYAAINEYIDYKHDSFLGDTDEE